MILTNPILITARLLPGVKIGDGASAGFVSSEYAGTEVASQRTVYRYHIDGPGWENTSESLKSGAGGGTLQQGLESLLGFLGAAAESYDYRQRTGRQGENEDLFPAHVVEWASLHSGEIACLQAELEETEGLINERQNWSTETAESGNSN